MFTKIIRRLNPLSGISGQDVVAIDFSGSNLKIAYTKASSVGGGAISILKRSISGYSDEDIAAIIKTTFIESKIKPSDIINVIPARLSITKNIEIPSRDPQEIREIVNLQSGRHTPYSRDEIIVDYVDIGTHKDNYTKVLLVMVTRNTVKRQIDILSKAGLKTEKIFFAPEGVGRFLSKIVKIENAKKPAGIILIEESHTDFSIIFRGKVLYVRSIPVGVEHLLRDRENYQFRFIEEIRNSLESYSSEDVDLMPDLLIITGLLDEVEYIGQALNDTLQITTKTFFYLKHLQIKEGKTKQDGAEKNICFLDVGASLCALNDIKINLIPEEVRLRKVFEEKSRDIVKVGLLALTAFVLVCCILISKVYFRSLYLNELNSKFGDQYEEVEKLENNFDKVKAVKDYMRNRGYSLEILSELYTVIPESIRIVDIKFDDKGDFSIKGTAQTMSGVFTLVSSLEKSTYFKDVKNRYATKRKEEGEDVADFEIICSLIKNVN
ncbi:pilus assembly protein PilM [Candidatus Omnitrophota bacterium]